MIALRLLTVENLEVSYDIGKRSLKAVQHVSFHLDEQDRLGLIGESGAGKSSVALALLGLLPSSAKILSGRIFYREKEITKAGRKYLDENIRWQKIAFIFQSSLNILNPVKNILDQMVEPVLVHEERTPKSEAVERCKALLDLVGIGDMTKRYPHELSGGEKQRAIIAISLVCRPEVLIADEPTSALDVITQAQIIEVLHRLQSELKLTLLLVTHDLPVAAQLCSRLLVMYSGKVMESGDTETILRSPRHPYTLGLVNSVPDVVSQTPRLPFISGDPPSPFEKISGCVFKRRCAYAKEICDQIEPPAMEFSHNHSAFCHFANDLESGPKEKWEENSPKLQ